MFKFKKVLPFIMATVMAFGVSSTAFAAESSSGKENLSSVSLQKISTSNTQKTNLQQALKIDREKSVIKLPKFDVKINGRKTPVTTSNAVASTTPSSEIWKIDGSVFAGDGNLTSSSDYNIYLVQVTAPSLAFLKLSSSNSNLTAYFCTINSNGTLNTTNLNVQANGPYNVKAVSAGSYAIAIAAGSGTVGESYTLKWNCSNPSGAKSIINISSDLARVVLFYDNNTILSNGTNIISTLQWKLSETWSLPHGYSSRDMILDSITSRGTYLGTFSSSAPYSANNALFIDVQKGSYLYCNSYYENDAGVILKMDYTDPTGLQTPRCINYLDPLSDARWNDGKHNSYIIVDLNTFTVVDFLSSFNYYYTKNGGRTYTANITSRLG